MKKRTRKIKVKTPLVVKGKRPKIKFDSWFYDQIMDEKLKDYHYAEIKTFFRELGLSDEEPANVYNEAFKKY